MGKYSSQAHRPPPPPRNRMPPLVRGIGCITMVLVPIVAFEFSKYLTSGPSRSWPVPVDWYNPPQLPPVLAMLGGVRTAWNFLQANAGNFVATLTTANIVFTVVMTVVIYGLMSVIYGYVFAMLGPSRYGPTDVPPPRVKTKKYSR